MFDHSKTTSVIKHKWVLGCPELALSTESCSPAALTSLCSCLPVTKEIYLELHRSPSAEWQPRKRLLSLASYGWSPPVWGFPNGWLLLAHLQSQTGYGTLATSSSKQLASQWFQVPFLLTFRVRSLFWLFRLHCCDFNMCTFLKHCCNCQPPIIHWAPSYYGVGLGKLTISSACSWVAPGLMDEADRKMYPRRTWAPRVLWENRRGRRAKSPDPQEKLWKLPKGGALRLKGQAWYQGPGVPC